MSAHYLDLVGQRFGRLTVIKQMPSKNYKSMWLCKCDCGNEIETAGVYLKCGDTKSCGCIDKERQLDYTGQRFGMLEVVKELQERKEGERAWLCKCDCGNERIVMSSELKRKRVFSCGCSKRTNLIDLTGQRFGRLTVIKRTDNKTNSEEAIWECRCDCGNTTYSHGYSLRNGDSKSCGCQRNEKIALLNKTHGLSNKRIYNIWISMKERCYNPHNIGYKDYGGRGIRVCEEWLNDFEAFYSWAMANGYDENAQYGDCTIDRIKVNGNYCPDNCRWATRKVQANNTRANHYVTRNGETHTVTEWCEILNVSKSTVFKRIGRGVPEEDWFFKGILPKRKE